MLKVLELIAVYGSQALALENLGIEFTSDISEIDKYAIQAYEQLHGKTHNWGDITKIDEKQLPHYDLITYSFPCQDISLAGLQRGLDKGTETRSSLLWECERIIRAVKPKYLLMENVKNLVGEKHKHNFIRWLHVLEMMGYQNFWKVLNAKDYGVPQNRERVFVVSILGCGQYLFPNPIKLEKRLKDIIENNVDEKYYLSDKIIEGFLKNKSNDNEPLHIKENTSKGYADAYEGDSVSLDQPNSTTRRGRVGHEIANTLTCSCNQGIIQLGNIVDTGNWDNPQRGRIYSPNGCSPALNTCQGGGLGPKIVCYDIPQTVTVRKHTVDLSKFIETLRTAKEKSGLSNKQISDILNQPLTMVEHWFRTDKSQSIPSPEQWYKLKELLELDDKYDAFVTEFEEREGTFEKANRCYGTDGIAPTMTAASSDEKIIHQYRIRKLTPRECWRLMGVKDEQYDKLHDISNSQLYKLAGNSIVVDVLMAIFKNLFVSDEETTGQLRLL